MVFQNEIGSVLDLVIIFAVLAVVIFAARSLLHRR
jgi:hypothetical protein